MSDLDHRVGVREANLVIRNLRLSNVNEANSDSLIEEIDRLFGIDEVSYNIQQGVIHLAYDATHIDLERIEATIRKHGAALHNDWWTQTKEGYYQFVDQNIKDNATHKPWSCHQSPQRSHRKRK
ncbi:cation transporter [Alteromonas sp. RKMC-009]|uniref:cation transporter n=1 Tax=Alteromonas sp. RKMC-009 TaxID=2267264 RepID=UPI000E684F89|nr:cation transporter [Alteromonas sp. RKMC-009]AYA63494.1 cation transporter [Alteromonas sp. RKMC-009]